MDIKLGKVLTYSEKLPSLKPWLFDHVIHIGSRDNLKKIYFHHQKTYGQ